MKPSLIVAGLGNPGDSYLRTRHNAGFRAVDILAREYGEGDWKDSPKFMADTCEARIGVVPVLLVKPRTYMNRSGESLRKIVDFYKIDPSIGTLTICDDIDVPLGEAKLRMKGGPGTHNGLKSIVQTFGEDFPRLRIGFGPKPDGVDLANWVLSSCSPDEEKTLETVLESVPNTVRNFIMEPKQTF